MEHFDIACAKCGESVYGEYGPSNPYSKGNWRVNGAGDIEHCCATDKEKEIDKEAKWKLERGIIMCYSAGLVENYDWHATIKLEVDEEKWNEIEKRFCEQQQQ